MTDLSQDDSPAEASALRQKRPAGSPLAARLTESARAERRRACRTLLQRPLLTADGPFAQEYILIRRHATWLREWLARGPGWTLVLDAEVARLRKIPSRLDDATRPARDPTSGAAFSRRRYVLFCLAMAALERSDRQTSLGQLADAVLTLASADPAIAQAGMALDLGAQDHRRDLVQTVRLLLELRVIVRVHGDEQQYLSGRGDVLYNVRRPVLAAMLCVKRPPSTVESNNFDEFLSAIVEEPAPETDEGRNRRLRSELTRRLLEDPVVYYDQLTSEQLAYLHSQRSMLIHHIEEATGLIAEVRREGIAMTDEGGELTDLGIPEEGTDGHLLLLLAEFLASHVKAGRTEPVVIAAVEQHVQALVQTHGRHWRRDASEPGAENALAAAAIERLTALGLVRRLDTCVVPLPAIGRYAVAVREDNTSTNENETPFLWGAHP